MISRRQFFKHVFKHVCEPVFQYGAAAMLLARTPRVAASQGVKRAKTVKMMEMKERIAAIIREYDAQGVHRTGTDVDDRSAAWLADRIRSLGVEPVVDTFEFRRVHIHDARCRVGNLDMEGVPLYDCHYTDAQGVTGSLGEVGSSADIGVAMTLPYAGSAGFARIAEARRQNMHRAILLVTDERLPPDGVATLNAESFRQPYGPPVLQVPNRHWSVLRDAADSGASGTVIAHCEHVDDVARNVGARVPGTSPDASPLVIMTPRSGWWTCASERGGGIAAFLEMMRAVGAAGHRRDVIFTANTGHELGHIGLDDFLERNHDLLEAAHMWIHLGANFVAKHGAGVRLQYSDAEARASFAPLLADAGVTPAQETPMGTRPLGEARNVFDGGGRYVSILGGNGLFHHPADTWPDAVDLDAAAAWIRALCNLAVEIAA